MRGLEQVLESIVELAAKDETVAERLDGHLDDPDYISNLRVKEILPAEYEESLRNLTGNDELSISFWRGINEAVRSLQQIKNEELGVILPWNYLDGPYTFEFGGREKKKVILEFLKRLLGTYNVPETVIEDISNRGW